FLCLLCSVPRSDAQQVTPPQQKDQPFTLSVDTQLVIENVIVKDKNGKDIEGLTAKDFVVTEDNVPQTIGVFRFEKLEDAPAANQNTVTVEPEIVKPPAATEITRLPQGDNRYDNRRLLVLFFDTMNVPPPDQLRAYEAADKFIRTLMQKPDL